MAEFETHKNQAAARRVLRSLAVVSLLLFLVLAILLLVWRHQERHERWFESPRLYELEMRLQQAPADEELKTLIRAEDVRLRRQYFRARRRLQLGTWLLAAAGGFAFVFVRLFIACRAAPRPGLPPPPEQELEQRQRQQRLTTLGIAAFAGTGLVLIVLMSISGAPEIRERREQADEPLATESERAPAAVSVRADPPAMNRNWPAFRGPLGTGAALPRQTWPTAWNAAENTGIVWKTEIPGSGNNSPLIWEDRIFCTSASGVDDQQLHCFSASDGRLLWSVPVTAPRRTPAAFQDLQVFKETGYAAPTAATNGTYVYVTFASADIAAFDFAGNQLWARNFGVPESAYGLSASLVCYESLVIWQLDQGSNARDRKSFIYGLDAATGATVWRTPRPVENTWSSPILAKTETETLLLTCGSPYLIAYDPLSGRELWRANTMAGDIGPSATYAGGVVFVTSTSMYLAAVRTGGSGDVTDTHVLWTAADGMPDTASPLTDGKRVLQATSDGLVTCFSVADGKLLWEQYFDGGFEASPSLAGGLVYLWGNNGRTWIFEFKDKYALKSEADINERQLATPAMVNGRIYIRGEKHLFCVENSLTSTPHN